MTRDEQWKRISAMAGLDEDGGILPPPAGMSIGPSPNSWWRTREYAEQAEHRLGTMEPITPADTPLLAYLRGK